MKARSHANARGLGSRANATGLGSSKSASPAEALRRWGLAALPSLEQALRLAATLERIGFGNRSRYRTLVKAIRAIEGATRADSATVLAHARTQARVERARARHMAATTAAASRRASVPWCRGGIGPTEAAAGRLSPPRREPLPPRGSSLLSMVPVKFSRGASRRSTRTSAWAATQMGASPSSQLDRAGGRLGAPTTVGVGARRKGSVKRGAMWHKRLSLVDEPLLFAVRGFVSPAEAAELRRQYERSAAASAAEAPLVCFEDSADLPQLIEAGLLEGATKRFRLGVCTNAPARMQQYLRTSRSSSPEGRGYSSSVLVPKQHVSIIDRMLRRIEAVLGLPQRHAYQYTQLLKYEPGEAYTYHTDCSERTVSADREASGRVES